MNNFFRFLVQHTTVIVFLFLEALALLLVFNCNDYHRASYLSSANAVTGNVYRLTSSVGRYFGLAAANDVLVKKNMALTIENDNLRKLLAAIPDSLRPDTESIKSPLNYRCAHAVGVSTNKSRNMLTLDEGSQAGIKRDMAVVNAQGVVGLVSAVSENFSLVLPVINTSSHLSVKIKGANHRGQLIWDGGSPRSALLVDIPEHAAVEIGDTIVTSGASAFFPEGITVGFVEALEPDRNGGFYNIGVQLAVDFNALYDVQVIGDALSAQRLNLENSVAEK